MIENDLRWLLARSDVERAMRIMAKAKWDGDGQFLWYVRDRWPHYFNQSEYEEVYRIAAEVELAQDLPAVLVQTASHRRYEAVREVISKISPERCLDVGCNWGQYTINLEQDLGGNWLGVDLDDALLSAGRQMARDRVQFTKEVPEGEKFDCLLLGDVLEHVVNPRWFLDNVLKSLAVGGFVVGTVPFGPVEYSMWMQSPTRGREHIREVVWADLRSYFSDYEELKISSTQQGHCPYTGLAVGFTLWTAKKVSEGTPGAFSGPYLSEDLSMESAPSRIPLPW